MSRGVREPNAMAGTDLVSRQVLPIEVSTIPHEWDEHDLFPGRDVCRVCGVVRRADDRNAPCRGAIRVTLREWERVG